MEDGVKIWNIHQYCSLWLFQIILFLGTALHILLSTCRHTFILFTPDAGLLLTHTHTQASIVHCWEKSTLALCNHMFTSYMCNLYYLQLWSVCTSTSRIISMVGELFLSKLLLFSVKLCLQVNQLRGQTVDVFIDPINKHVDNSWIWLWSFMLYIISY